MERQNTRTIFERFTTFMEQDTLQVKILTYGVTSVGLLTALYRIRPFGRFTKPSQIPDHFLKKKIPLQGTVVRIEPTNGTLLMVDHKPLIPLPRFNKTHYLPVKIAGLNITSNGISWLQVLVTGNKIMFVPVSKEKEYLNCLVTVSEKDKEPLQVGKELVKLGFATVHDFQPAFLEDKQLVTYKKSLISAQKSAERARRGYWQFVKDPTLLWKLETLMKVRLRSILPQFLRKQFDM